MALVEHEVPEHDLIHLLELRGENLEIVEVSSTAIRPRRGRHRGASLPRGLAAHLRHARRPGRDRGGLDGARGRRPGLAILEPERGRATSRFASSLALFIVAGSSCRLRGSGSAAASPARARRSRLEPRLDPFRLGRAPQQRRSARDRDHGRERRLARRQQVRLPGTVDSSAIYLHGVTIDGATHDAFFVTTTYGITLAIDAASGKILWRWTPPATPTARARRRSRRDAGRRPRAASGSTRRRRTG